MNILKSLGLERQKQKFTEGYTGWIKDLDDSIAISEGFLERRELLCAFCNELDSYPQAEQKIIHQGIKGLLWLERAQGSEELENAQNELQLAVDMLPKNFDLNASPKLALALSNFAIEMLVSNTFEIGLDTFFAAELLRSATTEFNLSPEQIFFYSAFLSWSAVQIPFVSPAGLVRMGIHTTISTAVINLYNKLNGIPGHKSHVPRAIDWITTIEYTATVFPLLPILNLADAYGIPLSLNTAKLLYFTNKIRTAKKLLETKQF